MGKKRFTIVELLVVIAVIAILLSILMPSLHRAKDMAKQAVCLANSNQFGQMHIKFILSNDFGKKQGARFFGNQWRIKTIKNNYPNITTAEARDKHGKLKCPTGADVKLGWGNNKNASSGTYYSEIQNPSSWVGWGNRQTNFGALGNKPLFETHNGKDTVWMFDGHSEGVTWQQVMDITVSPKLFDE
ncbi:MAG: type II secretion system GspH family protein [Lentisphaerales bacterium]|nr:type II secretion system GspH family protein [Lentisphaerales bacterium]